VSRGGRFEASYALFERLNGVAELDDLSFEASEGGGRDSGARCRYFEG
jgi:hypothetical protein